MKTIIPVTKNMLPGMNTSDIPEEMTSKLEDTAMQTIQNKAQKEKKVLKK